MDGFSRELTELKLEDCLLSMKLKNEFLKFTELYNESSTIVGDLGALLNIDRNDIGVN